MDMIDKVDDNFVNEISSDILKDMLRNQKLIKELLESNKSIDAQLLDYLKKQEYYR